jgi:hypothetical protein
MTTSSPSPRLTEQGKVALDALLAKTVNERKLPALFLAACSADEVLYESQGGPVDFDDAEAGDVDENTSMFPHSPVSHSLSMLTASSNPPQPCTCSR